MLPCPILVPPTRPAGARCRGPTVCRRRDVDTGRDRCMALPPYGTRAPSVRSVGPGCPVRAGFWGRTPAPPRDLPHTSMSVACVIISEVSPVRFPHDFCSWSCTSTRSCTCCFSVALSEQTQLAEIPGGRKDVPAVGMRARSLAAGRSGRLAPVRIQAERPGAFIVQCWLDVVQHLPRELVEIARCARPRPGRLVGDRATRCAV